MSHVHESPPVMILPLLVLAAGAVLGGLLFSGSFIEAGQTFWGDSILILPENPALLIVAEHRIPGWVAYLPVAAGLIGMLVAWYMYARRTDLPGALARMHHGAYQFLLNKWYFDEFYELVFVRTAKWLGRVLWKGGDGRIIDGFGPDGISALVLNLARRATFLQSGYVYHYAFAMLIGVALLVTFYMFALGS